MGTSQTLTAKNRTSLVGKKRIWLQRTSIHREVLETPDLTTHSEQQENVDEEHLTIPDTKVERRRAQNQAAQKAFRQRRDTRRKMLEDRVNDIEGQLSVTRLENKHLRAVITYFHQQLASQHHWNSPSFLTDASSSTVLTPQPSQQTYDLEDSDSLRETGIHDEFLHYDRIGSISICHPDVNFGPDFEDAAGLTKLASSTAWGPQNSPGLSALRNSANYLDPVRPTTSIFDFSGERVLRLELEEWLHERPSQSHCVVQRRYSVDAQDKPCPASTPCCGRSDESVFDFTSNPQWQQPWSWGDQSCVLEVDSLSDEDLLTDHSGGENIPCRDRSLQLQKLRAYSA